MLEKYYEDLKSKSEDVKVDLHMHSTASDGTWRPEKLIENVKNAGIRVFALTDHDTTENIKETKRLAKENGLFFIPGVEVNCTHQGHNYHILGLGIDPEYEPLLNILKYNYDEIEKIDDDGIRCLERKYANVSYLEYQSYQEDRERGGWKSLNYLIDKGLCTSHKDFFKLFEGMESPFKGVRYTSPDEVIQTIIDAGGHPVLAHPGAAFYAPNYKVIINFMVSLGLQGVECYHPENSPEITEYCLKYCCDHQLMITGGSDCHGQFVATRCLGKPDIRLSQLML